MKAGLTKDTKTLTFWTMKGCVTIINIQDATVLALKPNRGENELLKVSNVLNLRSIIYCFIAYYQTTKL